jgi:ABC-type branched-subunit amino acid transport system substrate-binding protein
VIFLAATTQAAISFVKQYGEAGGRAMLYGMSIIDPAVLLKSLGPDRARGYGFSVVLPLPSQQKVPLVREYLTLGAAAKDPDLSTRSIEGFIAAKLLVRALERAATLEPRAVAAAVASLSAFDAGGYSLDFSAPGRGGSRFVDFAMIGSGGRVTQ